MAEDAPVTPEEQKAKSKLPLKTILIILAVLLLEGGTITVFMVLKGGPTAAEGTNPIEGDTQVDLKEFAEVTLADSFNVDNYMGGKTRLVITMEVCAKVAKEKGDEFKAIVEAHKTEIKDTIRSFVASAHPDQIKDPKLQVIKREIQTSVEKIVGEGMIQEILVSSWQSYTAD